MISQTTPYINLITNVEGKVNCFWYATIYSKEM